MKKALALLLALTLLLGVLAACRPKSGQGPNKQIEIPGEPSTPSEPSTPNEPADPDEPSIPLTPSVPLTPTIIVPENDPTPSAPEED